MDNNLSSLLQAFYSPTTPPQVRSSLHASLIQHLHSPTTHTAAAIYLSSCPQSPDSFLLHFYLQSLHLYPPSTPALLPSLLSILISLQSSRNPDSYLSRKTAHLCTQLAVPAWISDPVTNSYPQTLNKLAKSAPTSERGVACIAAGASLAATLVEAASEGKGWGWRRGTRDALKVKIREMGRDLVVVLEVAARMGGGGLGDIKGDAVYALGRLEKVAPAVGEDVRTVLIRCTAVGGQGVLGILGDTLGAGSLVPDLSPVLEHCAELLETILSGGAGDVDEVLGYVEVVLKRGLLIEGGLVTERVLNGMMGVLKGSSGGLFFRCLESWAEVLHVFDDVMCDKLMVEKVVSVLSMVCMERCFWGGGGLDALEEEDKSKAGFDDILIWDELARTVTAAVKDVGSFEGLFFTEDYKDWSCCTCRGYVSKCIEILMLCISISEDKVGPATAEVVIRVLREKGETVALSLSTNSNNISEHNIQDLTTALNIARGLGAVLRDNVPIIKALFETLYQLFQARVWNRNEQLAIALFRATAMSSIALQDAAPQLVQTVCTSLLGTTRDILNTRDTPLPVSMATAVLVLCIYQYCSAHVPSDHPPISTDVIVGTTHPDLAAFGVAAMTWWVIVPPRIVGKGAMRIKWSPEEWEGRKAGYRELCRRVWRQFLEACGEGGHAEELLVVLERGGGLLKVLSVMVEDYGHGGRIGDSVWGAIGRDAVEGSVRAIRGLCRGVGGDGKGRVFEVMGVLVGVVGEMLHNFKKEMRGSGVGEEVLGMVIACGGVEEWGSVSKSGLKLVTEMFANGEGGLRVLEGGVGLGRRCVGNGKGDIDVEVVVAGVTVLVEAVKQYWGVFWGGSSGAGGEVERARVIYWGAMEGILEGIGGGEMNVVKAGLVGLQSLGSVRRLFEREEAFLGRIGEKVVGLCMLVLKGGVEGVMEEAVEVLWGIGKGDLKRFGAWVEKVVGGGIVEEVGLVDGEGREKGRFEKRLWDVVEEWEWRERGRML